MENKGITELLEKLKHVEFSKYKKYSKYAITAVVVVIALVFFGGNGEISDITKEPEKVNVAAENAQDTSQTQTDETLIESDTQQAENTEIYVDVEGMVKKPGVYKVTDGARMYEVIELAGGLLPGADTSNINQAQEVADGEKITIYEEGTVDASSNAESDNEVSKYVNNSRTGEMNTPGLTADGLININTADSTSLQEIPGVGPATAEKIINYRENAGGFKRIDDIKNVSGIGDKTFEKIKDMITI